ncbi:MAG: thiamine pyrophosphate-dependent dehydrogenase E1 component subunit alpha [Deinococcota bacterium]
MIKQAQLQQTARFEPFTSTPLAVTNERGEWTADFELDIDSTLLQEMYRDMLAARLLDDRYSTLQRSGKASFLVSSAGHEAAQIAIAKVVTPGVDWLYPYYRDTGLVHSLGLSAKDIFGQALATLADPNKGRQMPGHPGSSKLNIFTVCSAIASHVPPAVGTALSMKLRNQQAVTITSFGEGATSEGDFNAAINLAGAQGAPIIFVCENNGYAISVGYNKQTAAESIAAKGEAFGMPGYVVDGMDVLSCYYVLKEVTNAARAGHGPALLDMRVYRYNPHSSADDDSRYRPKQEVDMWRQRDPLTRFQRFLAGRDLWDEAWEQELKETLEADLRQAAKAAEAAGDIPEAWMFDDVFESLPWHLQEQRDKALKQLAESQASDAAH